MDELTEDGEGGEEEDEEPDSPMPTAEELEASDRRAEEWIRNKDAKDRAAAARGALPKRTPAPNTPYSPSEETPEDEDKHDHDGEDGKPSQSKDASHSVLMVQHVPLSSQSFKRVEHGSDHGGHATPLRDRLARLARDLDRFQDGHRNPSSTVSGFRSPSDGMAMLGMPSSEAAVQSACNMEHMYPVCAAAELCGEDRSPGCSPKCGTGPCGAGCGVGGTSSHLQRGPGQRESGPREDHGSSGSQSCDHRPGIHLHTCEDVPEAGEVADGTKVSCCSDEVFVGTTDCDGCCGGSSVAGIDGRGRVCGGVDGRRDGVESRGPEDEGQGKAVSKPLALRPTRLGDA